MSRSPTVPFAVTLGAVGLINPLAIFLFLPVLPAVKAEFGISDKLAQLTFSITLFTMAFMTLVYGSLADRYGRRPVLLTGLGLFLAGSTLAAIAESVAGLMLGRLVQAIGAGCGLTLSRTIAHDAYGPERLVKAIAYLTMFFAIGPMVSPFLGGVLLASFGWRSVFWLALAAGLVITLAAALLLVETRPPEQRDSVRASVASTYRQLFSSLPFTAFVLQTGFASGTFFALASASSLLMQENLGRPAAEFGIWFLVFPIAYIIGNFLSTRLSGRVPVETMVLVGALCQAVILAGMSAVVLSGQLTPLVLFVPGFLMNITQGLMLPNAQAGAIRVFPALAGTATGAGVFVHMLGGAAFSQLFGLLADGTPAPMVVVVSIGSALCLAMSILAFTAIRSSTRSGLPL